jgi:hypothetical protein
MAKVAVMTVPPEAPLSAVLAVRRGGARAQAAAVAAVSSLAAAEEEAAPTWAKLVEAVEEVAPLTHSVRQRLPPALPTHRLAQQHRRVPGPVTAAKADTLGRGAVRRAQVTMAVTGTFRSFSHETHLA